VQIQDALVIFFVLSQTWLVPVEAYLADRFGTRLLLIGGGSLAALAWVINAHTDSLPILYVAQVLSGCGSGIVYGLSMGNALKWFPDRRGLAAGLTAAAFGAGSALTIIPIDWTIKVHGYEAAFLWFGLGQGLVIVLAGLVIRFPKAHEVPTPSRPKVLQTSHEFTPREMLRTRAFWLLYVMMTVGAVPGLLMIGQLAPMAKDFMAWPESLLASARMIVNQATAMDVGVFTVNVTLLGITLSALQFALVVDRIMGGLTRPIFGWISDHIGRERAIFLAFLLEGASLFALIATRGNSVAFVLMSGLAFFGWGAVFSLFPAVSADMFGRKYATTNYALLYTAKGMAAILVSLCNRLQAETESWLVVFALMIAFDLMAALLALLVLPWVRRRLVTS
jgi:OFA family oxalate/formate antiporter-like MFS transporter